MKVDIIMGTRPGIVKMSSVYHAFVQDNYFETNIVYTGQHYSATLKDNIWEAFDLPTPRMQVEGIKDTNSHAEQIAAMMVGCERAFISGKTELVLVCGDANTNLAAGLAARKLDLKLGHVESGLRSRDWRMPEEHNRVILDHISDYLFSPTANTTENLNQENVQGLIYECGNSVVDALFYAREKIKQKSVDLVSSDYVLFTAHRQENVDQLKTLSNLVDILNQTAEILPVKFPMHPRTLKMLRQHNLLQKIEDVKNISILPPLPYLELIQLIENSRCVMTDSGGLQEESCILGIPCLTLRDNTERPETVSVGANTIVGTEVSNVMQNLKRLLSINIRESWSNPFGNGQTGKLIKEFLVNSL